MRGANTTIVTVYISVLLRLAGLDVFEPHVAFLSPVHELATDVFGGRNTFGMTLIEKLWSLTCVSCGVKGKSRQKRSVPKFIEPR